VDPAADGADDDHGSECGRPESDRGAAHSGTVTRPSIRFADVAGCAGTKQAIGAPGTGKTLLARAGR
jgi:hypothetical protein